jgi:hypothetical protein
MSLFKNKNVGEELLNKENILKYISAYDVYNYYIPGINVGEVRSSPFRKDNSPSFGIFIGRFGDLAFNDYKLGGGDFITFVQWMEGCSFLRALSIINITFNLHLLDFKNINNIIAPTIKPKITKYIPKLKTKPKISIQRKEWTEEDIEYWNPLNVKLLTDTYSIKYFWMDLQLFNTNKLAYAYRYGKNIYKIYQPLLNVKEGKWWSNISIDIPWFNHKYLPNTGDILFVTSSNKDASVLKQIGFDTIAPHSESQKFSTEQYEEYSTRFKRIIIFYDNDETGVLKAEKFCKEYNLTYIALEEVDTKDPFEFVKKYNLNTLKEFIYEAIN